jgi:hypothetical protein
MEEATAGVAQLTAPPSNRVLLGKLPNQTKPHSNSRSLAMALQEAPPAELNSLWLLLRRAPSSNVGDLMLMKPRL